MNKQKGITLIALIITIIVMLILVGVTINVALNGGLFDKAKTAREQTQKQVEKEDLITIAIGAYSEKKNSIILSELTSEIDTTKYEYDSEKSNEDKYVVKGKKTGIFWEINLKTAEVTEYKEEDSIYKVAYEYTDTNTGIKMTVYLIDEKTIWLIMELPDSAGYMETISLYDSTDIALSNDNNTLTYAIASQPMDMTRNKSKVLKQIPSQKYDETNIYINAIYTATKGVFPTNDLLISCANNRIGLYTYDEEERGWSTGDSDWENITDLDENNVTDSTIKWKDGKTYYLYMGF